MYSLRVVIFVCSVALPLFSGTIRVPADQATIQGAIKAAQNGDIVLVSPGMYVENIDFLQKHAPIEEGDRQVLGIDLNTLRVILEHWKK